MDSMRRPLYSGPIFPTTSQTGKRDTPHHIKGKIVGIRSGRSSEVMTTRILTIKISEPFQEIDKLLHADVEIQVQLSPPVTGKE